MPNTPERYADLINQIVNTLNIEHVLDYGCGEDIPLRALLEPEHEFTYQAFDPRVDKYSDPPSPAPMVVCLDYLDSCERPDDVLDDLEDLTQEVIFLSVKGHLERWIHKLSERFRIQTLQRVEDGFYVIANDLKAPA